MAASKSPEPSSPSSSTLGREWRCDVYLSRGEDTRKNFSDCLLTALRAAGITVFVDEGNDILIGANIGEKFLEAIEYSRISVIVISEHYASSIRCLEELKKIMECRRTLLVFPIFYKVTQSDVRERNGSFGEAFCRHEERFSMLVDGWSRAFTEAGNLKERYSGSTDGYEGKLVARIVEVIQKILGGRTIGKLFVSNKEIRKGSNGTIVFEGTYSDRVAVKRLVKAHYDDASKEIQKLIASDQHSNIVRFYGVESDQDFVYLSLERCICNLGDLIEIYSDSSQDIVFSQEETLRSWEYINLWKENGYPSSLLLQLMRDVVSGLEHLHKLNITHQGLKPQNVLIAKDKSLCAKVSDMGISKYLLPDKSSQATVRGSSGWHAPEQLFRKSQTGAPDLFNLGCLLFFCITRGSHPFGDHLERDGNIVKNRVDLSLVENIPEAKDLISRLLNPDPELRPKAWEVLSYRFFWSSEKRLLFLRATCDRVKLDVKRKTHSDLLDALNNTAPMTLGGKWNEKMDPAFITHLESHERDRLNRGDRLNRRDKRPMPYKFDSVQDLLRLMRDKFIHYVELGEELKDILGPGPEEFDYYFASRFPTLLFEVYKVVHQHCGEEKWFQNYLETNV